MDAHAHGKDRNNTLTIGFDQGPSESRRTDYYRVLFLVLEPIVFFFLRQFNGVNISRIEIVPP